MELAFGKQFPRNLIFSNSTTASSLAMALKLTVTKTSGVAQLLFVNLSRLYSFANSKEGTFDALWVNEGDSGIWDLKFSKNFNDWEIEIVLSFMKMIRKERVVTLLSDKFQWDGDTLGRFLVKRYYSMLDDNSQVHFRS